MNYRFLESEREHADRLGYFHPTRQLRRAILYTLTDHQYSELPYRLVDLGLDQLLRLAAVKLSGELLVPHGSPPVKALLRWEANALFTTADPNLPQLARMNALKAGEYHGAAPYPYNHFGGRVRLEGNTAALVSLAISTAPDGYTEVAHRLNRAGYKTATKRAWNKDTARTFLQNPIHAGYAVTYTERLAGGTSNKRGGMVLYRLFAAMPKPPIGYQDWLEINPVMQNRQIVLVNAGR